MEEKKDAETNGARAVWRIKAAVFAVGVPADRAHSGSTPQTANLANASALLMESLDDVNWVGFYLMEEGRLVLGPFQGRPA